MESLLLLAALLFVGTNVDKLVVVVAFCVDENYRVVEVLVGYYAGFLAGLAGSLVGAAVAVAVLHDWTFLLGSIPLGLGIWGLVRQKVEEEVEEMEAGLGPGGRIGIVTATAVGLNGENLAVYVPFFAGLSRADTAVVVAAYVVGSVLLFAVALAIARVAGDLGTHRAVDRFLVPLVLLVVGAYVVVAGLLVVWGG